MVLVHRDRNPRIELSGGEHQVAAFGLVNKVTGERFVIDQDEDGRFFAGETK